jgi:putative ABC transport system permease protein
VVYYSVWHVALRTVLYDKSRSAITLLGLVFAVGLIFAQLGIYLGLMQSASLLIDKTPGDIWITSKNSKNFDFSQPIPEYIYYHVLSNEGILWAEKLVVAWGVIKQKKGGTEQVEVVGYNPDTGIGGPWDMKEGDPRAVANGNFGIIDESAMRRLGHVEVGDYREVNWRRLQVVGISRGVRSFTTAPIVFTSYKFAQALSGWIGPDNTVFVVAKVAPGYSRNGVIKDLKKNLENVDVYSKAAFSRKTRLYWTIETGVGFSFLITILVSFFIGMLIVGQTVYNSTVEHIREFGTLKAMGASNFDISRLIFSQALIKGIVGFLVSLLVTLASLRLYKAADTAMVLKWWVIVLVFILTLVMCLTASLVSVRRVRKIDPAILFRS